MQAKSQTVIQVWGQNEHKSFA